MAPPGWIGAAQASGRVLVVYGSGFGLDRLSPRRIDEVLQGGDALCALVRWSEDGHPSIDGERASR